MPFLRTDIRFHLIKTSRKPSIISQNDEFKEYFLPYFNFNQTVITLSPLNSSHHYPFIHIFCLTFHDKKHHPTSRSSIPINLKTDKPMKTGYGIFLI